MSDHGGVNKLPTGIPGFDSISEGGLPRGRSTLLCGGTGSAKTTFGVQFLVEGVRRGEPGIMVTFEEQPDDIKCNVARFGWDLEKYEKDGLFSFIDASFHGEAESTVVGDYDLGGLLARIEHAVKKLKSSR